MSEEEKVVTHEDIWDDSALVNSWNEALEEYKKYHSIHADRAAEATIVPDSQNPLRNAKTETNEPQSPPNGTRGDGETIQEQAKVRTSATRDRGTPLILLHPQHASTRKEHLLTSPAPPLPRGPRLHPYYASLKPPDVKCQSRRIIKAWHFLFFLLCRTEILSSVPEGPMALLNPHIQLGPRGDRRLCKSLRVDVLKVPV